MAPRRKRVDPNDVVIDVDVPPMEPTGESAVVVMDPVAKAVAELEEKAKAVVIDSRKKDMELVPAIETVLGDVLGSLGRTNWDEVAPKEKAIVAGILTDKRKGLLDDIAPQRKAARKAKTKTTFVFDFANQKAAVTVDGDGDDE